MTFDPIGYYSTAYTVVSTIHKEKDHINRALIGVLINPGGCYRWEGESSTKGLTLFVYTW